MALLIPLVFLAYFLLYAFAFAIPPVPHLFSVAQGRQQQRPLKQNALDEWIEKEEDIALDKLLANVAPGGRNVLDAAPGSVIASPSKSHPNYYFQCKRVPSVGLRFN